jgi:Orsellinic acid/F9775 biosynthesis cluster protein D
MLDIPYDSPTITTSEQLQSVNCIVYNPLRILVCYTCEIAVTPSRLIVHRRSRPHEDRTLTKAFVDSLIQHHDLFLKDHFEPEEVPKSPVPGIPWTKGLTCGVGGCTHSTTSSQTMGRHLSMEHNTTKKQFPPLDTCVQVIFESCQRRYAVKVSAPQPSLSTNTPVPLDILLSQYNQRSRENRGLVPPEDPAVLNPLLAKYRWIETLQGISPVDITQWISMPGDSETLEPLVDAVSSYYAVIVKEMKCLDVHTTTLRWINSTKGCALTILVLNRAHVGTSPETLSTSHSKSLCGPRPSDATVKP